MPPCASIFDATPHQGYLTFSSDLSANFDLRNLERPDPVGSTIQDFLDLVKKGFHVLLEHGDADAVHDAVDQFSTEPSFGPLFFGSATDRTDH